MTRVLVTGAAGFVGQHLVRFLVGSLDCEVFGTVRRRGSAARESPVVSSLPAGRELTGDLTEPGFVDQVVGATRPDWVFHLAAQSSVIASWQEPAATLVNNLVAELNVLDSLTRRAPNARVIVVGSSEEYGQVRPADLPLDEASPLRPDSPYAVSKVAQDYLGLQYYLGRRLAVIRVRPFNLIGPGQDDRFALPSFARQIAEAEVGRRPPLIEVGNLEARRDFTDVRDAVRAYVLLAQKGQPGEVYNVGSETVHSIHELLDALRALARCHVEVRVDPARFRPSDVPVVQSNCGKLRREIGWRPAIPIEQTLRDILDDWRCRVQSG